MTTRGEFLQIGAGARAGIALGGNAMKRLGIRA